MPVLAKDGRGGAGLIALSCGVWAVSACWWGYPEFRGGERNH